MSLDEFRDFTEKDLENLKYSFAEYDPRFPMGAELPNPYKVEGLKECAQKTRGPLRWLVDNLLCRDMVKQSPEEAERYGTLYARRVKVSKLLSY